MDDLISIIITAYNEELYIERAIDSALSQTHSNVEIIIIDDGSNDDTNNLASKYINKNNIKLITHSKPMGLMNARNHGVQEACGEYITFLDADDRFANNKVEAQYNKLKELEKDSILFIGRVVYTEQGVPLIKNHEFITKNIYQFNYLDVLKKNKVLPLGATMMLKRSHFLKLGGFDPDSKKERDFIARFGNHIGGIFLYGEPLYIQHRKPNSMSVNHLNVYNNELSMINCWDPKNKNSFSEQRKISSQDFDDYKNNIMKQLTRKLVYNNVKIAEVKDHSHKFITYKLLKPLNDFLKYIKAKNRYKKYKLRNR